MTLLLKTVVFDVVLFVSVMITPLTYVYYHLMHHGIWNIYALPLPFITSLKIFSIPDHLFFYLELTLPYKPIKNSKIIHIHNFSNVKIIQSCRNFLKTIWYKNRWMSSECFVTLCTICSLFFFLNQTFSIISLRNELVCETETGQGGSDTSVPNMGKMPQHWEAAEGTVLSASPQAAWNPLPISVLRATETEWLSDNKPAFPNFPLERLSWQNDRI